MKLLVFGNVGSGKSSLIKRLVKYYPWEVVSIDDYRRRYGDGSKRRELIARREFIEALKSDKDQFVECVGLGKVAETLFQRLHNNDEQVICIVLHSLKQTCRMRLKNREWDVPFPASLSRVNTSIERNDVVIRTWAIEKRWSKRRNTIVMFRNNMTPSDAREIVQLLRETVNRFRIPPSD